MKQITLAANASASPPPWLRWIGFAGLVGAVACNAVLGIEEAELTCLGAHCPDAGGIVTENESLGDDGSLVGALPVGGSPSSRPLDAGADAAGEPALPGSPGSELGPDSVLPPNTGGSDNPANGGDDDDDGEEDNSGSGSGNSGENPGSGGGSGSGDSSGPGSGNPGSGAACAPNEARCRGTRLERCNADRTALEMIECGSSALCNEAAARCDACEPNAARCENATTAAICDSTGAVETFIECATLSACNRGVCEVLGVGL